MLVVCGQFYTFHFNINKRLQHRILAEHPFKHILYSHACIYNIVKRSKWAFSPNSLCPYKLNLIRIRPVSPSIRPYIIHNQPVRCPISVYVHIPCDVLQNTNGPNEIRQTTIQNSILFPFLLKHPNYLTICTLTEPNDVRDSVRYSPIW